MSMAQVLKIFADEQGQASLAQTLPVLLTLQRRCPS
jgi:hypothetical protein